jgi:hypothetical protein
MARMPIARICVVAFAIFTSIGIAQAPPQIVLSVMVTDQSGAVIAGAGVRATDRATGTWHDAAADANGRADVRLAPGIYTLRVQAPGFRTHDEKSVEIKESMSKSVSLRVADFGGPIEIIPDPKIQVDRQWSDIGISPVPLGLVDLRAKPMHHGFHLGTPHS